MVEAAGASAVAVHGRTAEQAYHGLADWDLIARVAAAVKIPVLGCGDLLEPEQILERLRTTGVAGVLAGRGILRNPWLFAQAADLMAGRHVRAVTPLDRGRFLLQYIDLLQAEGPPVVTLETDDASGRDTRPPSQAANPETLSGGGSSGRSGSGTRRVPRAARGSRRSAAPRASYDRWIVNKLRALCGYYTKGFEGGGDLRVAVNLAPDVAALRTLIADFFGIEAGPAVVGK
jgi:tRNA-dihydrouridine synthase